MKREPDEGGGGDPPARSYTGERYPRLLDNDEQEQERQKALRIWDASQLTPSAPFVAYFRSRGLTTPTSSALRFHSSLEYWETDDDDNPVLMGHWPAIVALVTRGVDGKPIGIHRTYVAHDGNGKAPVDSPRKMKGVCKGGVVRLAEPRSDGCDDPLLIGEGLETCLSAHEASGYPVWAALSKNGLVALELPDDVRRVVALADIGDKDGGGEKKAVEAAEKWQSEGRRAWIARPRPDKDFNDLLQNVGPQAVANAIDEADEVLRHPAQMPQLLSKRDFLAGFVPPEYVVDGLMQRGFVYSFTGATGSGKTAIALLIAQLMSSTAVGQKFGPHDVDKGTVAVFSDENSTDVRMRVKGSDALRNDNPQDDHLHFIDGVFDIKQMRAELQRLIERIDGVDFVIVDTSAAYFLGQDENSNPQMGEHARMLRSRTKLPGSPCVLVLCHPIKHATEQSQLLPRGGGAFLAEVDGNFTCWENKTTGLVEVHWAGKLRGPGFEPILFKIDAFTTEDLVDDKGRPLPTVRALHVSENEEEARTQAATQDDSQLLVAMLNEPKASVANLCRRLNWMGKKGDPQKSRLHRVLIRLRDAKPKLVQKDRGQWELTDAGRKAANAAAKQFNTAQFEHQRGENRVERHEASLALRSIVPSDRGTVRNDGPNSL